MTTTSNAAPQSATFRVAAAQDAPVFLDPVASTARTIRWIEDAADRGVELLAFGETWLPGYPFWLSSTGGARFDDPVQKAMYAKYLHAALRVDGPELAAIADASTRCGVHVVLGFVERGTSTATGSTFASLATITPREDVVTVHRKLVPTYEERLAWAPGDGHGLRAHEFVTRSGVTVRIGALNCWENWMPLARHTMWAQGIDVLVASWPGAVQLTEDITRFAAREGRVFVLSAGSVLRRSDVPNDLPISDVLPADPNHVFYDGGSAIAGPDGRFVVAPVAHERGLVVADLDLGAIARERQNFDVTGHYTRPDVFHVTVNRSRRPLVTFDDEG
jgi:nitrilase